MPSPRAKCGTDSGYRRHLARREKACDDCLIAHAEANRRPGKRRTWVRCGTDAGYYRHIRVLKEPACDPCKVAHAATQRRYAKGQIPDKRRCPCGTVLRTPLDHCSICRKRLAKEAAERENAPKPSPVGWVRQGRILVAVYDRTEVA